MEDLHLVLVYTWNTVHTDLQLTQEERVFRKMVSLALSMRAVFSAKAVDVQLELPSIITMFQETLEVESVTTWSVHRMANRSQ